VGLDAREKFARPFEIKIVGNYKPHIMAMFPQESDLRVHNSILAATINVTIVDYQN
jgi:hypothetical protein